MVLTTGALVFFSAIAGNFSQSWLIATGHYRGRMIEYGVWAGGALIIGLGVLPVVAALAGLVRPKDERRTARLPRACSRRSCASASTRPSSLVPLDVIRHGDRRAEPHLCHPARLRRHRPLARTAAAALAPPGGGHRPRGLPARLGQLRARERPVLGRTRARHRPDVQPQPLVHGQRSAVGARRDARDLGAAACCPGCSALAGRQCGRWSA